jgi:hypothetical protein
MVKNNDPRIIKIANGVKKFYETRPGSFYGKKHSEETKSRIAKALVGNNNGNHRGDRQSYYNNVRMDSSWEVLVAKYLDGIGVKWEYGKTVFRIDERRSYRPDFILDNGLVIEVKGYWREENKEKFEEFKLLFPSIKIEVWDKEKLKELKLI